MGILEFFNSLVKHDITASAIKVDYKERSDIHHLLFDFNSIIHVSSQKVNADIDSFMKQILKHLYQNRSMNTPLLTKQFDRYKMQHIQKKIVENMDPDKVIDLFHEHFTTKVMDKLVITLVINTVLYIIRTYCHNTSIKTIVIAIDGVPSKAKMLEQRQRRYLGTIIESYKTKILAQYKDYLLERDDYVYVATKRAVRWSRNNITPGTAFMHKLVSYLSDAKIQDKLRVNRPQMKIVISDMYQIGEGEKKIVNYVNKYLKNTSDNIMVYSPDADMILLCILLPATSVYVLRYDQQSFYYDLIDVTALKTNISYYINNHPSYAKTNFNINRINYDLVCINSLFGNDFVPKIETINVKRGFQNILDAYLKTLLFLKTDTKQLYLVEVVESTYHLNFVFLKNIIKFLLPLEQDFIKYNNLYNIYINAGQIKNVFDYMEINEENIVSVYHQFRGDYEQLKHAIKSNGNYARFLADDQFMTSLKRSINIRIDNNAVTTSYLSNKEIIKLLQTYYHKYRDFPRLNINLNTYSRHIDDPYYKKDIEGFNRYQKEVFKFEKMLDDYQYKFNAQPLNLTKNKVDQYYETYFDIKLYGGSNRITRVPRITRVTRTKGGSNLTKGAAQIMHDYLEGLVWVFNYYFNDASYINIWYYPHERAPLLQHLYAYCNGIDDTYLEKILGSLDKYHVTKLASYFNPIEQLIYVSPLTKINMLDILPANYREYLMSDKLDPFLVTFFADIKDIVNRLWSEKKSTDVDCHGALYFNKCLIKSIHKPSETDDETFLQAIRKVKPTAVSIRRSQNTEPDF